MMVTAQLGMIHCSPRAIETCYCADVSNLSQSGHTGQMLHLKDDKRRLLTGISSLIAGASKLLRPSMV